MKLFEEFWESGVPLVGEAGARGWSQCLGGELSLRDTQSGDDQRPDGREPAAGTEGADTQVSALCIHALVDAFPPLRVPMRKGLAPRVPQLLVVPLKRRQFGERAVLDLLAAGAETKYWRP
jgi:hypothetical protein